MEDCFWLSGNCPDDKCGNFCYFTSTETAVECSHCGQTHDVEQLKDLKKTDQSIESMTAIFANMIKKRKDNESVKVKGLSNYQCKLISHMFSEYGYDKNTGSIKSLAEIFGQNSTFDCSRLSNRAFRIEKKDLGIPGYGIDNTAEQYLRNILNEIKEANREESYPLVPIHVDGDGYCLAHAISRCLSGRQLFWHPLMMSLKKEFEDNIDTYRLNFQDFIVDEEWPRIIEEADPDYFPQDGEQSGLRNIHIFALANVLRRPIILLDSKHGLNSNADFSGLFLPAFKPPEACKLDDGKCNEPLIIAWSNNGRNHFVPLVSVKDLELCTLPRNVIPKVWGVPGSLQNTYMDMKDDGSFLVAGTGMTTDDYLHKLVHRMEQKFHEIQNISASLVADYYHEVLKMPNRINTNWKEVLTDAKHAVEERLLYKCKRCGHIVMDYDTSMNSIPYLPGGDLYQTVKECYKNLEDGQEYFFRETQMLCRYSAKEDRLYKYTIDYCERCTGCMRVLNPDGSIWYKNGDRTEVLGGEKESKVYWDGDFYDNEPMWIRFTFEWNGKQIKDNIFWFHNEKDEQKNSNAYIIAEKLICKHFENEHANKVLMESLTNQIIQQTSHLSKDFMSQKDISNKKQNGEVTKSNTPLHMVNKLESTNRKKNESIRTQKKQKKKVETIQEVSREHKTLPIKEDNENTLLRKEPCIKIQANGKQSIVSLSNMTTCRELCKWIEEEFAIPLNEQELKTGFPPRILNLRYKMDEKIPLQGGDMVRVQRKVTQTSALHERSVASSKTEDNLGKKEGEDEITMMLKRIDPSSYLQNGNDGENTETESKPDSGSSSSSRDDGKEVITDKKISDENTLLALEETNIQYGSESIRNIQGNRCTSAESHNSSNQVISATSKEENAKRNDCSNNVVCEDGL